MAVREVGPGRWEISYYPHGRKGRHVRKVLHCTEIQARRIERALRRQHHPPLSACPNPAISAILPDFLEHAQVHFAPKTAADIERSFKWLKQQLGHLPVNRLTPALILEYQKSRPARAANKELAYLRSLIKFGVSRQLCEPLPWKMSQVPYRRPLPRVPAPDEVERFITAIKGKGCRDVARKQAVVRLMWECGLRWVEASNLRWEQIDWPSGVIRLVTTKGGRPGLAYLPVTVRELLEPLRQPVGFLFAGRTGKPWRSPKSLFRFASDRAKISPPLRPHQLRHAFATYALEAVGDLRAVQALLRHQDVAQTEWYTQVSSKRLREASEQVRTYVSKTRTDGT